MKVNFYLHERLMTTEQAERTAENLFIGIVIVIGMMAAAIGTAIAIIIE
jgi:hypothetical protein